MMSNYVRRQLDGVVDELKRAGYQVLIMLVEKPKPEEDFHGAMEVLCSETNNPLIVAEMAKAALEGLSRPHVEDGPRENLVN